MSKKEDEWLCQYPSTTVKWKIVPTGANATPYIGAANNFLYQIKNRMAIGELDQLRAIRYIFGDMGAVLAQITAGSAFGQDFIEIRVPSVAVPAMPTCVITLINVPEEVPPMKWYDYALTPFDEATAGVDGVDYIKTYYTIESKNCKDCSSVDFTICDAAELQTTYGWTAPQTCTPFTFVNADIPVSDIYPNYHCIYGSCQAEIIKVAGGESGGYFIWKAYTEWSSLGPIFANFTKNGLGYLLLRALVNIQGVELCRSEGVVVKVDCCLKDSAFRPAIMFWEKCDLGWQYCPIPEEASMGDIDFFWILGGWNVIGIWMKAPTSQQFSCPPYEWTLHGEGEINPSVSELGAFAEYRIRTIDYQARGCSEEVTIDVRDRCGQTDYVHFKSCCGDDPDPVVLGYTTLAMTCSQAQTFSVSGGCSPLTWSLSGSGGGTLVGSTYTAPATNPECVYNPTITVTDCCGTSDSIQISVNCYGAADVAYHGFGFAIDTGTSCLGPGGIFYGYGCVPYQYPYRCDGTYLGCVEDCYAGLTCRMSPPLCCHPGCGITERDEYANCKSSCMEINPKWCPDTTNPFCSGDYRDYRTAAMKTNGCCPLNPGTGLPF